MRASRLWPRLALGCLLWSVPAVSFAQGPQTQGQPQPTTILAPDEETTIFTPEACLEPRGYSVSSQEVLEGERNR